MPKCSSGPPGLLLVHLMMIKLPFADSIVGPSVTRTRSASLAGGSIVASGTSGEAMELEHNKLLPRVMIANGRYVLDTCKPLMSKPHEVLTTIVQWRSRGGAWRLPMCPPFRRRLLRHLGVIGPSAPH